MVLWQQLQLQPGVLCLTGSGGKTTLAHTLAAQLPGRVIFCTTTRIFPSARMPVLCEAGEERLREMLAQHHAVCIGTPTEEGKLAPPRLPFERLKSLADYVVVEADGSRGLPLKAHGEGEPVLPACRGRTLLLVGAGGFGCPIAQAVHRPEVFTRLTGAGPGDPATPELVAAVLRQEGGFDTVIVNQVTEEAHLRLARRLAAGLDVPVFAGQVRTGALTRL